MHAAEPAANASPSKRFRRQNRVRKPKEFAAVFGKGRTFVTPVLIFRLLPTDLEESRLGLAVSRKVGKAVKRNKVRRRIREGFRLKQATFPRSFDIVVSPRKGVLEFTFEDYLAAYDMLIRKMHHWGKPKKRP